MAKGFNFQSERNDLRTLFPEEEGIVSLAVGAPDEMCLRDAKDAVKRASEARLDDGDAHLLMQYGPAAGDSRLVLLSFQMSFFRTLNRMEMFIALQVLARAGRLFGKTRQSRG